MSVVRLPVSQRAVHLRRPAGAEDLLLLEAAACDTALALELAACLAQPADGVDLDWGLLPVTDLDALLLLLRQLVLGDLIRAEVVCSAEGCGQRFDVSFQVGNFLAHHQPGMPDGVAWADETGWFRIADTVVRFRLPTAADQVAAARATDPEAELIRRCVDPPDLHAPLLDRVQEALEALAPSLSHDLQGQCPECGVAVAIVFDAQRFCLRELREQATFIYEDVALLAQAYHWSEAEILALPRQRRMRYAEIARQTWFNRG
jgi:hypothetical protein